MLVYLFITIDTEEDLWDKWNRRDNSVENVSFLPQLQKILDQFGAIPTYLVNYPVVTNPKACEILQRLHDRDSCEIGGHIHPWNTPPFQEEISSRNSMICNLTKDLAYQKLENLTNEIENRIGIKAKSFRAGRWGFGPSVARCIHELGYMIDTSITPFSDWTTADGPDFSDAQNEYYRFKPDDIFTKTSNGPLLELPPTIGFFRDYFGKSGQIRKLILNSFTAKIRLIGILDKLGLLNLRWLSPEHSSGSDMIKLARSFVSNGQKFLNMSFHSPSLIPGKSPYVQNESDLAILINRIKTFLAFAVKEGFTFAPVSAALDFG